MNACHIKIQGKGIAANSREPQLLQQTDVCTMLVWTQKGHCRYNYRVKRNLGGRWLVCAFSLFIKGEEENSHNDI